MRAWRRPRSIRTRLTLWYSGLLLLGLVLTGALSHWVLEWSLARDVDASLLAVAQVLRDTRHARTGFLHEPDPEGVFREVLGGELLDKFFQLLDPQGEPNRRPTRLGNRALSLSAEARRNAARGARTFETVALAGGERVRVLTIPIVRNGRPVEFIQVGSSLARVEGATRHFLQLLFVLVPLGVALAAAGGAWIARAALAPVGEMARRARQITAEDLRQRVPERGARDELDYLAETLNEMLGRLEQAFGTLRRFTADAAHELRTPLTALKGGLEVALRSPRSAPELERVLRDSLDEVDRLARLVEDLLTLSRATAGSGLARARVDLEPLVLEALELGARLARGTGVAVRLGAAGPAPVTGDQAALSRLLRNLVENAVRYTPAGGIVELSLETADGAALVTVADTGIGIDPADADRIFEPFVRLDAARSRETGGVGLGLAIARSIALAHGGTLTVASVPKAGSLFTLRLPAV